MKIFHGAVLLSNLWSPLGNGSKWTMGPLQNKVSKLRFYFRDDIHCLKLSKTNIYGNCFSMCARQYYSTSASTEILQPNLSTMKIDIPEYHALFTPEMKTLSKLFESKGYELRIAGGAIRDILLHLKPNSLDFATTATPDQMKTLFNEAGIRILNTRGESHGTVTVRINDKEDFEITTLRIDVATYGRRAVVEFTTDWDLDVKRRDFTINAMYLGLDGTLYDYFNGYEDLKKRKVKFIGEPGKRIAEDYLRILRYFRFYGRITNHPNNHDPHLLLAIQEKVNGLSELSGARIWKEMKKILLGPYKYDILKTMLKLGIAPYIGLPSSFNIKDFDDFQERAERLHPQPVTILSSLIKTPAQMMELNTLLNLPACERDLGFFLICHRDDKPNINPLYPYQALIAKPNKGRRQTFEYVEEVLKYRGDAKLLEELRNCEIPKFPVHKDAFLERGIKGEMRYDRILTLLKKKWIDSQFSLTEDELIKKFDDAIDEDNLLHPPPKKFKKKKSKKIML